jgi:hypothetical protein
MSVAQAVLLTTGLAIVSSCAELHVHTRDKVEVRHEFGLTTVSISPTTNPAYVESEGLGLVLGQRNAAIGWMKEQTAIFPDAARCAVLILSQSPDDVKRVNDLLNTANVDLGKICTLGGTSK